MKLGILKHRIIATIEYEILKGLMLIHIIHRPLSIKILKAK